MRFQIVGLIFAITPLFADGPASPWTRLMDLNVVAVDKSGTPVNDLTADDLTLSDAGKPQKIVYFHRLDNRPAAPSTLGPNEFSNRNGANSSHATVILFDLLNERMGTRANAWSQIVKYLSSMESSDDLYLYLLTLDGRLFSVRGLNGAESQAPEPGAAPWTRRIKPMMDQAMTTVTRLRPVDIDVAVRVQLTYRALGGLTAELSKLPGRKNIVWITDGVPMALGPRRSDTGDFVDFTPQLRQLSEMLHRFGVTIYPSRQIMLGSQDGPPDAPGVPAGGGAGAGVSSDETLDEFARMTGGRPDAGKDIAGAIKQAMTDARASYQIGYYPDARSWDNKFHKIRITCTRKGVTIRARGGYFAWPDTPDDQATQAIKDAVSTSNDAAGIGLRGSLVRDPQDKTRAVMNIRIDAADLALPRQGDQYTGQLRLAVVAYQANGAAEGTPLIPLDLHYTAQDRDKALREGVEFSRSVTIAAGVKSVRFVIFDLGSNAIGSLMIPTVAPETKDAK